MTAGTPSPLRLETPAATSAMSGIARFHLSSKQAPLALGLIPNFQLELNVANYLLILLYCVSPHPRRATCSLRSPHRDEAVIYQETKTHSSP